MSVTSVDSVQFIRRARELLAGQKARWESFRASSDQLANAQTRTFDFGSFAIQAQHNPGRLMSVSARTDDVSIQARPCFLCGANRPAEQMSHDCGDGYKLLCNPFPILPEHFTIVHETHRPQRIADSIGPMLRTARLLSPDFDVFYNGPQCGASAPDHLHLQAALLHTTPLGYEYERIKQPIHRNNGTSIFAAPNYLRPFISLESSDPTALTVAFAALHDAQHRLQPDTLEPMMNVHCWFADSAWRLVVFPRRAHRPSFYFAPETQRLLLSPGAIDMAGVVVVPRDQDFRKVTHDHLRQMYHETSVTPQLLAAIVPLP